MERVTIDEKIGLKFNTSKESLGIFYGAKGENLYETISAYYAYQVQGAPTSVENRHIVEAIPYGLVYYTLLGEQIGVPVDTF